MQKLQRHSASDILVPENLILGLKAGAAVPEDWTTFSAADGLFLKGTDSDLDVGTPGARSSVSVSTGSGGSHSGSAAASMKFISYYSTCTYSCGDTKASSSSVGGHSGHSVPITYRPPAAGLRLIRATKKTPVPLAAIMFGLAAHSGQTPYNLFNSAAETPLMASAVTTLEGETRSASTTSSRSYSHVHWYSEVTRCQGVTTAFTSYSAGGPSHTHSGGTPSITQNLLRATVRAFEIIDERKIEGLIGMWAGSGVPDGWTIVAALVGRYLVFSATGDGSSTGDNTISVSGSTGSSSHNHGFSGSEYNIVANLHHSNNLSHSHSYSASPAYEPERYLIKFIQYTG